MLLLVPFVGLLWVPFYDHAEPELFGFPFFYWYQFIWVFLAVLVTAIVYRLVDPRAGSDAPPPPGEREKAGDASRTEQSPPRAPRPTGEDRPEPPLEGREER